MIGLAHTRMQEVNCQFVLDVDKLTINFYLLHRFNLFHTSMNKIRSEDLAQWRSTEYFQNASVFSHLILQYAMYRLLDLQVGYSYAYAST